LIYDGVRAKLAYCETVNQSSMGSPWRISVVYHSLLTARVLFQFPLSL